MLLAFSAKPEELDILMLSLTFGNVEVQKYVAITLGRLPNATSTVQDTIEYNVLNISKNR
jgi:inosine-uridine nucleoside N-ribohydrolase